MFDPTKLRWAPPTQSSPTVFNLPTGNSTPTFADDEDVILIMPATPRVSQATITGGRHVRLIGGSHVTGAGSGGTHSLLFQRQTGSVFVEGVAFDNAASPMRDCLFFAGSTSPATAPDIYVQNCTMRGISGTADGTHGDAIQVGSHPIGDLRVDCVDVQTGYQGFITWPTLSDHPRPSQDISRCTLSNVEEGGQFLLYLFEENTAGFVADQDMRLRDVWLDSRAGWTSVPAIMPHDGYQFGARSGPIAGSWQVDAIKGYLIESDRSPFTIGTPGLGYVSPGYNGPDDQPVFVAVSVDGGGMKPRLLHHFLAAQPDGVYRFPAAGGAVSMTWSGGTCSYSGTITVPVEQLTGGQGPMSLTFVDGLLTAAT